MTYSETVNDEMIYTDWVNRRFNKILLSIIYFRSSDT